MSRKFLAHTLCLSLMIIKGAAVQAALHDRSNGLLYDDVLNITWLQDANHAQTSGYTATGRMTWDEAVAWAENLVYAGYDDWRLASISVEAGLPTGVQPIVLRCDPDEVRCRDNEIGYMFYWNLGGVYGENKTGDQTSLTGVRIYNIQRTYWTGTEFKDNAYTEDGRAWTFPFESGIRNPNEKYLNFSVWAVRPGDVGIANYPPKIAALTAVPLTILDNETSQLSVAATDPDGGPQGLGYQWTVINGGGVFGDATSPNAVYTPADVIGTQTVTLRVSVTDGAATVSQNVTLTVQDANPPPPGTALLSDDFSGSALTGWSVHDEGTVTAPSKWGLVSGVLAQQSNINDGSSVSALTRLGTYLLYDEGLGWTDYQVKLKLRSADDDTLGAMFRYMDKDNYYRFSWDKQRNERRLVKKAGGVFTLLAADNVPYVVGQNYQVEVVVQGSQLEVWVDGVRIFQVIDAAHSRGSVAFYTWMNNGANFDNLVVEDLSGGNFNALPKITAVTASPSTILDTEISNLTVTATDPDNGPQALSYQWTIVSGGGVLDNATSATPIYTAADGVGTQSVKLKVEVSDGAASVSGNLTLTVEDANPPPLGPELLKEDFSGATLTGWSVRDEGTLSAPSKWRLVSGELAQLSNITDASAATALGKLGTYLLYDAGLEWTDYRAKFKLRTTDDDGLGFMFRFRDGANYYRFSWDKQLNQRRLVKRAGGVFSVLAADNVPYVIGQNYQVEIVAQGSQLEVWIDGARIFQITDASLNRGSVAVYSWQNNAASFDDIQVNAIE